MAEQRPTESSGTSPGQESGPQERDQAQEVSTQVDETARQVARTTSAYSAQGREKMGEVEHYLEDTIRTKPLQSVLLAAGVGLLIALLWKR